MNTTPMTAAELAALPRTQLISRFDAARQEINAAETKLGIIVDPVARPKDRAHVSEWGEALFNILAVRNDLRERVASHDKQVADTERANRARAMTLVGSRLALWQVHDTVKRAKEEIAKFQAEAASIKQGDLVGNFLEGFCEGAMRASARLQHLNRKVVALTEELFGRFETMLPESFNAEARLAMVDYEDALRASLAFLIDRRNDGHYAYPRSTSPAANMNLANQGVTLIEVIQTLEMALRNLKATDRT